MPKGTGGHRFKKGDPKINRKGAPKVPQDLKALNHDLKVDALKHLHTYWFIKVENYADELKRKDMTMGERMIAAAYGKAAKDGNLAYVEAILNRILGKPPSSDAQNINVSVNNPPSVTFTVEKDKSKE